MSAFSDYLESGLLHHIFRGETFAKPSNISIALTNSVPLDVDTGATLDEVASGDGTILSGYSRVDLGDPSVSGDAAWEYSAFDHAAGSGVIRNVNSIVFETSLVDWGWVSGIAVLDSPTYGAGKVLFRGALDNPRQVFLGDSFKFDPFILEIELD